MKKVMNEVIDPINISLLGLVGVGVIINMKQVISLLIVTALFCITSVTTYTYCKKH